MKFKFISLFLYIVLFSQVNNEFEIKVKTLKTKFKECYLPFMIYFDYKSLNTNKKNHLLKRLNSD